MKRASTWGVVALAALVAGVVVLNRGGVTGDSSGKLPWERDLPTALSRARGEKKLVMVDFYTDWCQWCRRLDQTTFSNGDVQRALQGVVSVRLNAEKDGREAAERFGVDGYPTLVFLDAGGNEVGRIPGYVESGPFLAELANIIKKA